MPRSPGRHLDPEHRTNPYRLVTLRNVAILGETLVVLGAALYLEVPLPLTLMFAIIGAQALFNALTWLALRQGWRISDSGFFVQLLADVFVLAALLFFSGGATNPFVSMFLVPLMVSATVLPGRYTWMLAAITVGCYTLLLRNHVPLPHTHIDASTFGMHVIGMWLGFVLAAGLIAYFVVGMGRMMRQQQEALAQARERALRDAQLVQLGTLAASTAHEMGTPLATMALLSEEMEEACNQPEMHQRLGTLRTQIQRCKSALATLSASAGGIQLSGGRLQPVDAYVHGLLEEWRGRFPAVGLVVKLEGSGTAPCLLADRTLTQALVNILDNAAQVSAQDMQLTLDWDAAECRLAVCDRGPGLTQEARRRIGHEPYSGKEGGLGIGLFLAHAVIQRFGGTVELFDRDGGGICTHIHLPCTQGGD